MIKALIFNFRLRKAIRLADALHLKNGSQYMVININNRPVVMHRLDAKEVIKKYKLNMTMDQLRQKSLYTKTWLHTRSTTLIHKKGGMKRRCSRSGTETETPLFSEMSLRNQ